MTDAAPTAPPVREGDRIELTVNRIAAGGDGISRYQGFTVFVPFSAPGDTLRVEIREVHARFARHACRKSCRLPRTGSRPRCRHFGVCGGCQLQHLSYPAQLAAKKQIVTDALARIGGVTPEVREPIGMADPWRYRNRARFTARDGAWGSTTRADASLRWRNVPSPIRRWWIRSTCGARRSPGAPTSCGRRCEWSRRPTSGWRCWSRRRARRTSRRRRGRSRRRGRRSRESSVGPRAARDARGRVPIVSPGAGCSPAVRGT